MSETELMEPIKQEKTMSEPPALAQDAQRQPATQVIARPTALAMGRSGIEIKTLDDAWRFADFIIKANMAPKGMNQAGVVVAMELGMELGLPIMAAIQNIMVVNGRPSVWGDMLLAICQTSDIFDADAFAEWYTGDGENLTAHCRARRRGINHPVERTFSVADAKKAGLWTKEGPWQQYPKRMLQMRARGFCLRDCYSDVTKGIYAREEVDEIENGEPLPPIRMPRRLSESTQPPAASTAAQEGSGAEPTAPAAPVEQSASGAKIGTGDIHKLHAVRDSHGVSVEQLKAHILATYQLGSTKDISVDLLPEVIEWLESHPLRVKAAK